MKSFSKKKRRVMVFGVFDFLHPGHVSFLRGARKKGDELIVSVARDRVVKELKHITPHGSEVFRLRALQKLPFVFKVVRGDAKTGTYNVIRKWKPDVICLGYDQKSLKSDLEKKMRSGTLPKIPLFRMNPHKPQLFRSSLYRTKKHV